MKKFHVEVMVFSVIIMLILTFCVLEAQAESNVSVTFPMETGATAFWFPSDGTYAVGLAHTFLRVKYGAIPNMQLDVDATVAREVNQDKDTLAGVGVKVGYKPSTGTLTGFAFEPSIGVTALNNWTKSKILSEILQNYRIAIYGTILLYRW